MRRVTLSLDIGRQAPDEEFCVRSEDGSDDQTPLNPDTDLYLFATGTCKWHTS